MMERNKFARGPWTLQDSGSVVCPDHTLQNTPVLPPDGSWKDSCSLRRDLRNFIRDLCRVRLPCRLWHSRRRLQVLRHRALRTHRRHEGRYQGAIISQGHSVTCFKKTAQRVMEERAGFKKVQRPHSPQFAATNGLTSPFTMSIEAILGTLQGRFCGSRHPGDEILA